MTSTVVWMMANGAATEATAWKALLSTTNCIEQGRGVTRCEDAREGMRRCGKPEIGTTKDKEASMNGC